MKFSLGHPVNIKEILENVLSSNEDAPINNDYFYNTIEQLLLLIPQFKVISDCRQRKFSQPVNHIKHDRES